MQLGFLPVSDEPPQRRRPVKFDISRLPPHDSEVEQAVLGCIMLSPKACIAECVTKFGLADSVFYDLRHQAIFNAMVEMDSAGKEVEFVAIVSWLKTNKQLDQVGGMSFISTLSDTTPSAANLPYYLDILLEKYKLRKAIAVCTEVVSAAFENNGHSEELLDMAERDILGIRKFAASNTTASMRTLVTKSLDTIEEYHRRNGAVVGLGTGFIDLDKLTGGLVRSDLYVIAGRPSGGKTSLVMNIAEHIILKEQLPVGVFSLEMKSEPLVTRMICSQARVNWRNMRDGFLVERDFPKITGVAGKLFKAPLYIDDSSGLSIMQLRARARRMQQQYGIRLFIIDYLQLLHATIGGRRIEKREREISEISAGCKSLAKELDVPVIVLCQLSRLMEREKRKPVLSDLRESGAIEQDADTVGLLYREKTDREEDDRSVVVPINLFIAKQRNGPIGDVKLTFLKEYTRFESAAKIAPDEDWQQSSMAYNAPSPDP